jgi:hypothetical protein
MKKTATCCFIALCLASCQKSAVNPSTDKPPVSFTSKNLKSINSAVPFNSQQDIDIAQLGLQGSTCTGELLQVVSGTYHIDIHGTINDNKLSILQHANARDFKLVGLSTGAIYTGSSTTNETFNTSLTNGKFIVTETQTIQFTTPGRKNNSILQINVHETINAQGQLTAYIDKLQFGCK